MAKKRKPSITNEEIVNLLTKQGLVPESKYSKKIGRRQYVYDPKTNNYKYIQKMNYQIPIDIYTKVIKKKFNVKFSVGNMVRFREKSTRTWNKRAGYKNVQDFGDIYDWSNLGIGTGTCYDDITNQTDRYYGGYNNNNLKLGSIYVLNKITSHQKVVYHTALGHKLSGFYYTRILDSTFYKTIKLDSAGLIGQKKLINGTIINIFVHFIYPNWESKREPRYEVLFETGARGIFTGDRLDRVFDTDFDVDEKISQCNIKNCQIKTCDHKLIHLNDNECNETCFCNKNQSCEPLFDYTQLCELTIHKGGLVNEEEKDKN